MAGRPLPAQRGPCLQCHLAPFAGIAFLWFIGVLRNRFGPHEDRFFASVFLGSGLLFVASLYASAAFAGADSRNRCGGSRSPGRQRHILPGPAAVGAFLNVFAIKMAGVFIISTSTIVLRTEILPRWIAFVGYACALVLLLAITSWPWIALLFPAWMLVLSIRILVGGVPPRRTGSDPTNGIALDDPGARIAVALYR